MKISKSKLDSTFLDTWIFEIIIEDEIINISKQIRSYISNEKILKIKSNFSITKLIKRDINPSKLFYWKISNNHIKNWMPITILGGIPFNLNLNKKIKKKSIKIVYFINSDISNCFLKLMSNQLLHCQEGIG